ncbi:hypothetical protein QBC35DRAFT_556005 [Podospora australis]|uniref:Uncharacterized protein n=1 Tax=Podospora australis TaxID=1536484 RepID=A0AAN7AFT3_9PEZI|nr:hypothetical protein QBC35DRAFT_556005 [Podospora australis]
MAAVPAPQQAALVPPAPPAPGVQQPAQQQQPNPQAQSPAPVQPHLFSVENHLNKDSLPHLAIRHGLLHDTQDSWEAYLSRDLRSELFDEVLFPYVWPFARHGGHNVDPLHKHVVKDRTVVVSEDPKLHLVWSGNVVYLKPVPEYLFNHEFWLNFLAPQQQQQGQQPGQQPQPQQQPQQGHQQQPQPQPQQPPHQQPHQQPPAPPPTPPPIPLPIPPPLNPQHRHHQQIQPPTPREKNYRSTLGFLRSYALLIQHESDFLIAHRAGLLPSYISFPKFQKFITPFRQLTDEQISSPRYFYGQFRLNRLNLVAFFVKLAHSLHFISFPSIPTQYHPAGVVLLQKERIPWHYQEDRWTMKQYIKDYAAPLVFVFAVFSLVLGSMQVVLAALGPEKTWAGFVKASWGFSVATIIFSVGALLVVLIAGVVVFLAEFWWAAGRRWKGRRGRQGGQGP